MRDVRDRGVQTIVNVWPHIIEPQDAPHKIQVRSKRAIQTEAHIEFDASYTVVVNTLRYTPYDQIIDEAILIQDIPKKFILKFDDNIIEEDIQSFDDNSTFDPSVAGSVQANIKSNLRTKYFAIMETKEIECQTDLIVRPMVLHTHEVAEVICNIHVQTSATFLPNASMEEVNDKLHKYYQHKPGSKAVQLVTSKEIKMKNYTADTDIDSETKLNNIREAVKQLTSTEIENICYGCCTEEEVLEKIKEWYKDVTNLVDESEPEDEYIDEITGQDICAIENNIVAGARVTVESLEAQADRMNYRYNKADNQDIDIQCSDSLKDHLEPGLCRGGKHRDQACTCDCQLYTKQAETKANNDLNESAGKLSQIHKQVNKGGISGQLGETVSSPALIKCPCPKHHTKLPLPARACTNRKCNCLNSKGCLPCEQALQKKAKMGETNNVLKLKSSKKIITSQNIEFLVDVDGDYADEYLENLGQDDVHTQTDEESQQYFGTPEALVIPEPPCTCLTSVEMPWDILLIPPKPKKRPAEVPAIESLPEVVRAQLKELTVRPITEEQLLALTREFLEDNIGNVDDIDEIQKQILAEKARISAEVSKAENEEGLEDEGQKDDDDGVPYVPCRPRAAIKQFQVFDPECEVYNEPYMDRIVRAFCEEEMGQVGECTSHVEMPWHEIELAKTIVIRKGRHPCERRTKSKALKDPHRKCGPLYREQLREQQAMFNLDTESACSNASCNANRTEKDIAKVDGEICEPCAEAFQQENILKRVDTETCICPPDCMKQNKTEVQIISCIKGKRADTNKTSASLPMISKSGEPLGSPGKPSQSRTERIAALLDSCKKEMEPIKTGINELRARIKELNLPDMLAYQEQPQHPSVGSVGVGSSPLGFMGSSMGMQMPPVCFPPPMMCYPYPPPCMFPQVTNMPPGMSGPPTPKAQELSRKYPCKSKHHRKKSISSYNSSTETATPSTDYDRHDRRKSPKRSRSRFICSCKAQESKHTEYPCQIQAQKTGTDTNGDTTKTEDEINTSKKSSTCICSIDSKSKAKSISSKIPRLVSSDISKKVPCVCPICPSLATQESAFKSCKSTLSEKSVRSEKSEDRSEKDTKRSKSCKSLKSSLKDSTSEHKPKENNGTKPCEPCNLVIVESCATQKSETNMSRTKESTSTSCRIRFEDNEKRSCLKCKNAQKAVDAGVEVKRGRPTEESSEDASTKKPFKSCKTRKASN